MDFFIILWSGMVRLLQNKFPDDLIGLFLRKQLYIFILSCQFAKSKTMDSLCEIKLTRIM